MSENQAEVVIASKPSMIDYPNFDANMDAAALRDAMQKHGTIEHVIISIVGRRTLRQRLEIKKAYGGKYGRDLTDDLKTELSGNFEDVVITMFLDKPIRDARFLYKAMHGAGNEEQALIEVLSTRSNYEIEKIKKAYKVEYGKELVDVVKDETSSHFKNLLVLLIQANRDNCVEPDLTLMQCEAKRLYEAGAKHWGTDEDVFNEIFSKRSFAEIQTICKAYKKLRKITMAEVIADEFSGDIKDALMAAVEIAYCRPSYFARCLYSAMCRPMRRSIADATTLIRIVVTRTECDMENIKKKFESLYGKSLYFFIMDKVDDNYKKILLSLVSPSSTGE